MGTSAIERAFGLFVDELTYSFCNAGQSTRNAAMDGVIKATRWRRMAWILSQLISTRVTYQIYHTKKSKDLILLFFFVTDIIETTRELNELADEPLAKPTNHLRNHWQMNHSRNHRTDGQDVEPPIRGQATHGLTERADEQLANQPNFESLKHKWKFITNKRTT